MESFQSTSSLLISWGKILLLGAFSFSMIQAMRGEKGLSECFERLCISMIFFVFYISWSETLEKMSIQMTNQLGNFQQQDSLKKLIFDSLKQASHTPTLSGETSFNIPAIIEQVWRTGVWGIMSSIVEFVFLLTDLLIECARVTLWKLVLLLFPLACGVYPVMPRIMINFILYLFELALWAPILSIIRTTTAFVAKDYLNKDGSLGLYVIGIELIAIILLLSVPAITHKLLSGAIAGDFGAQSGMLSYGTRALSVLKGVVFK